MLPEAKGLPGPRSDKEATNPLTTCDSSSVVETRTFRVAFVSKDSTHAVDPFYKYVGEKLPAEGEIISVVRFLRGRATRARVTLVEPHYEPQIAATQID